ncbi:TetR/AcrR family transcriptional regulator [Actinomadura alba]|nr:TetR/AcrR family transcriptional regulator [Actinomadura alba]
MRADARRNYERLLAEAKGAFLEHGVDVPLEDVARRAGVGIGTLYRHFPTRLALQEAVYRDQVDSLVAKAYELDEALPPGEALAAWMRSFVESAAARRGLMQTLKAVIDKHSEVFARCHDEIREAVGLVLARAQEAGTVRPDVTVSDVLRLNHALSVATEHAPQDTGRLLSFLLDGLRSQS